MHRNDDSNYFLYIEPELSEKTEQPVDDAYTEAVQYFFDRATAGTIYGYNNLKSIGTREEFSPEERWRGTHICSDGETSSNQDYLFINGFITNSLCIHYARWFRNSITGPNLKKLERLKESHECPAI